MSALQPGEAIGERYIIDGFLGRGSMANVYSASDRQSGRAVAIKVLLPSAMRHRTNLRRFEREARAQARISHRNVAQILDLGVTARSEPYLVVELLRGRSLRDVVADRGRIPAVHAASYAWQALQGLAASHEAGVLHRDLKPANLMLEPSAGPVERVVVIDFGFASLEGADKLTLEGHVVGSLGYLAPERLRGELGDLRSDLYSLGVVLYELLVGRRPFIAESDVELIALQVDAPPVPPTHAAPEAAIAPALEAVVLRALAKNPAERYPTAAAMADALEAAAST
ncbi:MAG TPA: serine/threonine-protein kinase [Kofleriaceae bacterium]|nr:serine/threonine-protein kinase [Kofleriaceae bacterium]